MSFLNSRVRRETSRQRWKRSQSTATFDLRVRVAISISALCLLTACGTPRRPSNPTALNSYYTDEQPALSGDGRFLALVSNRDGQRNVLMYDLQQRRLIDLPRLNLRSAIAETPSLSYSGRYLVYLASDRGRPEIELYDRITNRTQVLTMGYQGWVRNPSISPDGRFITFETGKRGQWDIETLDRGPNIELDLPDGTAIRE
jgi:Tol biopolymer transport system component